MSLVIETHISCDKCGDTFGVDNRSIKGYMQRKLAANNGWVYSVGKDYCPTCRPNMSRPMKKTGIKLMYKRCLRTSKNKKGLLISYEEFEIISPGNPLNGQTILRIGTPKERNRFLYLLNGVGKPCRTIQSLIDQYKKENKDL